MLALFWPAVAIATALALAYGRASLRTATATCGGLLLLYTLFADGSFAVKFLDWLLFGAAAAALNIDSFRIERLSARAMKLFAKLLPAMSPTERTALDAGTVWWDGELFSGRPRWHRLLGIRNPELSPAEQEFLDGPVEKFCRMLDEWEITHELADLPAKAWSFLKDNKFFGMIIPESYGGLGFSAVAHSAVLARIGSSPAGMTASSIVAVPNSLGPAELLLKYGTAAQKDYFLPRLAVGQEIPCFALTSPYAGSDAGAIPDKAVICRGEWEGEQVIGMRLTWDKRYITLAPVATVLGLAVRMYDPEHLLGMQDDIGITCCLIPTSIPGVQIGRRHLALNAPFMNGPTRGKDVFVPLDMIIGGPAMAGQGWRMLMECLAVGRAISLPSGSSGTINGLTRLTGAYARVRKQFGMPIGQFEGVQEALARIAGRCYATNAMRVMTAGAVDLGEKPSVPSAIAKHLCTSLMQQSCIDAMDVTGGKGVMLGPKNWAGRAYQGAPISITVEGANILTRSMIIFGQGAIRCHPYALREMTAVADDDLMAFDQALFKHIGHSLAAASGSLLLGISGSRIANAPNSGPARRQFQRVARYSANLALLADLCMASLGGALKFRESLSARLGDVLSQLYMVSAALKHFEESGRPAEDLPLLDWVCATAFHKIEIAMDGVLRNLPARPLAWLARGLIFPLGRRAAPPSDATVGRLAALVQEPGSTRDRLTAICCTKFSTQSPMGLLENALAKVLETEGLERRLNKAARDGQLLTLHPGVRIDEAEQLAILSHDEARLLRETWQAVEKVIAVDDFSSAELAHISSRPKRATARRAPRRKAAGGNTAELA